MQAIVSLAFLIISTWAVGKATGNWIVAACFVAGMIVFGVIRAWPNIQEQIEEWKREMED